MVRPTSSSFRVATIAAASRVRSTRAREDVASFHAVTAVVSTAASVVFSSSPVAAFCDPAALYANAEGHGFDVRAQGATAHGAGQELRVGPARDFVQPIVQHLLEQPLDEGTAVIADRVGGAARALADQGYRRLRDLRIGDDADERLLVKRHVDLARGRRLAARRQPAKSALHQVLELLRVHIPA